MKIYNYPKQARGLREMEAKMLEHVSKKITQVYGGVQSVQTPEEILVEKKEEKESKKNRKKKDSKKI